MLPAFADLGYKQGEFPQSEQAANEVLSLPMYPEMTAEQCDTVAGAVIDLSANIDRSWSRHDHDYAHAEAAPL